MDRKILVSLLLTSSIVSGCQSTFTALQKAPPEKYVEVIPDDIGTDVEESLKAAGVNYVCKEFYAGRGSSQNRRACFVKAPPASMNETLGVKMSDLPSAILADTGRNAIIAGQIALTYILNGGYIPH